MSPTQLLVLQLIASSVLLYAFASCAALWMRFKSDETPLKSARLLILLAGALPLVLLWIWSLIPFGGIIINFFSLSWLLGIAAGLVALPLKLSRLATGIVAAVSTGCLCALLGAFVLAMLD